MNEQPSFLRLPAVMARTGIRKTHIYKLMSEGKFPRQVRLSHKLAVWRSGDIDAWIHEQSEAAA